MIDHEPNSIADFESRFIQLCKEAREYGMSTVWAVMECDHLTQNDDIRLGYNGGKWTALGLVAQLKHDLLFGEMARED